MKPELFFTWPSENGPALDNIKLKKTIKFLVVKLTATCGYNLKTHAVGYKLSLKDTILNGRITVDPSCKSIDYRKKFAMPLAGKFGNLLLSGSWAFNELNQTWDPAFKVGFEFGHGSAEMVRPNTIRFKPRVFLKNIGLQAKALVTLHLPSKVLLELGNGSQGNLAAREDEDSFGLNMEMEELDLVIRL